MNRFPTERDAKEFLVSEIVREAESQGRPLTEIERQMLYFSETGWSPDGTAEAAAEFDRLKDSAKYERKIAALIRGARKRAPKDDALAWSDAIKRLSVGDHYLLVMVDQAGDAGSSAAANRMQWRMLIVILPAFLLFFIEAFVLSRYLGTLTKGDVGFCAWVTAVAGAGAYGLIRVMVGGRDADAWMGRVVDSIMGVRRR
jgi:hypothetical protein